MDLNILWTALAANIPATIATVILGLGSGTIMAIQRFKMRQQKGGR